MHQEPEPSRRVLVTGASGFIGGACARECLRRGWRVTALAHRRIPQGLPNARTVTAPLEDLPALEEALLPAAPFDAVINAAGRASDVGPRKAFLAANFRSVENLITLLPRMGSPRLVHISTTDVYGLRDFVDADEATPLAERPGRSGNPYPQSKILAERALTTRLSPKHYVILRPGIVWGPGDPTILPRLIGFLRSSPVLIAFGRWRGENRLPLAHVRNVARAACLAAACEECLGRAYNVADPEVTTFEQYCRLVIGHFLPEKRRMRSVNLSLFIGRLVGAVSTLLSNLLGRDQPLWDPTLYSLYSTCLNLDFSTREIEGLFAHHGEQFVRREEGFSDEG